MKISTKIASAVKKAQRMTRKTARSILGLTPISTLAKNRKAVNAVIANIILVAAVIVVGFATLGWVQSQSTQYQQIQTGVVNRDVSQLQERLSFEYVSYNSHTLTVYLLNSGTSNNVNVTSVQIGSSAPLSVTNLYLLNGTSVKSLTTGQDGYFTVSGVTLNQGTTYTIRVITSRGSTFVTNFAQ
jgi:hypothetical protein